MAQSPERFAEWRSRPDRLAIRAWENRTYNAALRQLAREYPARMLAVLDGIREQDPRPGAATKEGQARAA